MVSVEAKSIYNSEIQAQIHDKIEFYKTKAYQAALPIILQVLPTYQTILMGEGNLDGKMNKIKECLGEFVKGHNENPALSTKRDVLEQGTDVIAKNIFAHLATKVGQCFTSPAPGFEELRTLTGLLSMSTSPEEMTRFFELRSIQYIDPLMDELHNEFASDVLEQYPSVQQ